MRRMVLVVALLVVAPAPMAAAVDLGSAATAGDAPSEARLSFSPATPATPAEMTDHLVLRSPDGPEAAPSALDALRIQAPAGTRFDRSAAPLCTASDLELQVAGPAACPDSRIGDGRLDALTGVGLVDPLHTKLTLLNGRAGPISLVQEKVTGAVLSIDRFTIEGSALVAHPPRLPGATPELRTVTREIEHRWSAAFVTTPERCAKGEWSFQVSVGFADGTTQKTSGTTPCAG